MLYFQVLFWAILPCELNGSLWDEKTLANYAHSVNLCCLGGLRCCQLTLLAQLIIRQPTSEVLVLGLHGHLNIPVPNGHEDFWNVTQAASAVVLANVLGGLVPHRLTPTLLHDRAKLL